MLAQFRVENFKSFKNEEVFSMVASSSKEREFDNVFEVNDKLSLLKSAVIYGANASGKSNLVQSLAFMKRFIQSSSKESQIDEPIKIDNFKLSEESEKLPSSFEITFFHKRLRYRFGFSVDIEKVHAEWLYMVFNKKEVQVFFREGQNFNLSRHFKSEESLVKEERVRPNALFISVSAQFNGKIAGDIIEWFSRINFVRDTFQKHWPISVKMLDNEKDRIAVLELLQGADLGIVDLKSEEKLVGLDKLEPFIPSSVRAQFNKKQIKQIDIKTEHRKYNESGEYIGNATFDLNRQESLGTRRYFELIGVILDSLRNGKTLIVDELVAQLHPRLIEAVCGLFNSKENNPGNAQLIFSSHNTDILKRNMFRRDQVWFVEKDRMGASRLYSLAEYKKSGSKVRKDASFEKDYLMGKYGGVPCVNLEISNGE